MSLARDASLSYCVALDDKIISPFLHPNQETSWLSLRLAAFAWSAPR